MRYKLRRSRSTAYHQTTRVKSAAHLVMTLVTFLALFKFFAASTFGTNLVQGFNSAVSGASSFLAPTDDCEMDGGFFTVKSGWTVFSDYDCYMTQIIDVTFARNYLLNPGGKVMISMKGTSWDSAMTSRL
ncbi:membrane-associated protein, putative [Bodo saltans]|uniref:Membrane-associated protein, putative n=1 Tax=Bodo saltans TaxID=75058 RepID=A0A0S4IVC6_BODSA|nr:membrane-associated protein, putative [Bodo saltans]|eukprot:CUG03748.1 membrane-associated protein, putative [Bodo saltans]